MDHPPEEPVSRTPILEIERLQKHYGSFQALKSLSLTVYEGEVYGFLGRNGAGKSTTIRSIMGITKPSAGRIRLFGEELGKGFGRTTALRQSIGYVAQEQNFYGWMTPKSLGRFVSGFYPSWDSDEYLRLLEVLELPLTRKIRGFSGGMKVKVGLAAALSHRPRLLVLDEPCAGLDAVARREFLEMVQSQARSDGRTTFFSSHLIDEVELAADRVGIVDQGKTRFEGPLSELSACFRRVHLPSSDNRVAEDFERLWAGRSLTIMQDRLRDERRLLVLSGQGPEDVDDLSKVFEGAKVERMSLEDIFVDMVSQSLSQRSRL